MGSWEDPENFGNAVFEILFCEFDAILDKGKNPHLQNADCREEAHLIH